jgi:hypothetical protein
VAYGTGTQGTPATATGLAAEVYRKPVTSYANGANPGEGLLNSILSPSEIVGAAITEVGLFGGPTVTSTPGSGVLIFYGLYAHTHTNKESIQVQWDRTI